MQSQRVFAQVDEGSISGTVQDPSGAVVPGAQVTLLNTDQGITLKTTTNSPASTPFRRSESETTPCPSPLPASLQPPSRICR